MIKKLYIAVLLIMAAFLLGGCNMMAVDQLYCLPMRSQEYTNLRSVMEEAMEGKQYSAPLNGDNQQSVQAVDLNGDELMEYVLFAKDTQKNTLQILVFAGDGTDYELLDTIDCSGTAFDKVEYAQMDNAVGREIVVGLQLNDRTVRSVSVYSLIGDVMDQFLSTSYVQFKTVNPDGNRQSELFILRSGESEHGAAVIYYMDGRDMEHTKEIALSQPMHSSGRIIAGTLHDEVPCIAVSGMVDGSTGTDLFIVRDKQLEKVEITLGDVDAVQLSSDYELRAWDIDDDGITEIPIPVAMHTEGEEPVSDSQCLIRWCAVTSDGKTVDKLWTYHNFAGGWYLELTSNMARRYTVTQLGSSFEFYYWNRSFTISEKLMTVYVLTGQKREEQAVMDNRFVLSRTESTIYAASLEVTSSDYAMPKDKLMEAFHLIRDDRNTGGT